jgi:hypothetical protein
VPFQILGINQSVEPDGDRAEKHSGSIALRKRILIGSDRFTGDVDFDAVKQVVGCVTPNPRGTEPMTVFGVGAESD